VAEHGDATPSITGRSDEMPGVTATDGAQAQSAEDGSAESGERPKRISFSGD
jgi:hypothetical protein